MKPSGIVYLVLKGLPTPVGTPGYLPAGADAAEAEHALAREEAAHAFLSQLIKARALVRLVRDLGDRTCEDVWRERRASN